MSIDQFDPRNMMQALIQRKQPRRFFRDRMVRRSEMSDRENVDVDTKTEVRVLAPFVNPNKGAGKSMDRLGFSTNSFIPPMVSPKRLLTPQDLQKRLPGENVYSQQSADERGQQLVGQDLATLDDAISRREEWMIAQGIFNTGTFGSIVGCGIPCVGDDYSQTFAFARNAACISAAPGGSAANGLGTASPTSTKLTTARTWDASTADIPVQIRQARRLSVRLTGLDVDFAVCGASAAEALLTAPSLSGLSGFLNTLRADLGQINPRDLGNGVTYLGTFAGTGIDLFTYDEWYIDPTTGTETPMVPDKQIAFCSSQGYNVMHYGAVAVSSGLDNQAQLAMVAGARVPDSWITKEPAGRFLKVSSRPLFVPVQNDAIVTIQVLA